MTDENSDRSDVGQTELLRKQAAQGTMPFFSVIIATRDRPALFRRALESVLVQSSANIEIIVINDSSTIEHQREYDPILRAAESSCARSFDLAPRPKGHGGSYVRNFGAAHANAPYLCFLDDDDYWTDPNHLGRAQALIAGTGAFVDLYMTNQAAFLHDKQQLGPIWLEDLPAILSGLGNRPDRYGAHTLTVDELLQSGGFCHLNTLIVRRALYNGIGGMEEAIRWEHDRDLYLRLIDRATVMKYAPITVSRHNIPDPAEATSITTALSYLERLIDQLMVLNRALYLTRHPAIRTYARRHKAYTLKLIAQSLASAGRHVEAAVYARDAFRTDPTVKWGGYTVWRTVRALASPSLRALDQDIQPPGNTRNKW
jgi:glycosyltransferase involved in cell wall biosynthesis